jgi:DNA-binding NarL/FixJ family response regulator
MPSAFIIIFTGIKDFGLLMEVIQAGADGIISKCIGLADLEISLYRIEGGEQFMGIGFKQFMMASRKGIRNTGYTNSQRKNDPL